MFDKIGDSGEPSPPIDRPCRAYSSVASTGYCAAPFWLLGPTGHHRGHAWHAGGLGGDPARCPDERLRAAPRQI